MSPRSPSHSPKNQNISSISGNGPLIFQFHAPGLTPEALQFDRWQLSGLTVRVAGAPSTCAIEPGPEGLELRYDPGVDAPIAI